MATSEAQERIAASIARQAAEGGGFLLASLLSDAIREKAVDTSFAGWEEQLHGALGGVVEQILSAAPPLERPDGRVPGAARDLVIALAFARGTGMPARDVWPEAATAVAGGNVEYRRGDTAWVLAHLGRYIVESGEDGQAVYRLFHRLLVSPLRASAGEGAAGRVAERLLRLFLAQSGDGRALDRANPYLLRHLPAHLAAADAQGWPLLKELIACDPPRLGPPSVDALEERAVELTDDPARAYATIERALNLPTDHGFDLATDRRTALLLAAARYAHAARDDELAAKLAMEGYALGESLAEHADPAGVARLVEAATLGGIALQSLGELEPAVELTQTALRRAEAVDRSAPGALSTLSNALTAAANRLAGAGRFEEALELSLRAYGLAEQLAEVEPGDAVVRYVAALYNLATRWAALGEFDRARAAVDEALERAEDHLSSPALRMMHQRLLQQRVGLTRELEEDPVPDVLRYADARVDDWLATRTVAARLGWLERERAETLDLIATVTLDRRLERTDPATDAAARLEGLRGVLTLEPRERELLGRPRDLAEAAERAAVAGPPERSLALSRALLAAGQAGPDVWRRIADAKAALGDDAGARLAAERAARARPSPPA